jgi:hypothetical protein
MAIHPQVTIMKTDQVPFFARVRWAKPALWCANVLSGVVAAMVLLYCLDAPAPVLSMPHVQLACAQSGGLVDCVQGGWQLRVQFDYRLFDDGGSVTLDLPPSTRLNQAKPVLATMCPPPVRGHSGHAARHPVFM